MLLNAHYPIHHYIYLYFIYGDYRKQINQYLNCTYNVYLFILYLLYTYTVVLIYEDLHTTFFFPCVCYSIFPIFPFYFFLKIEFNSHNFNFNMWLKILISRGKYVIYVNICNNVICENF
jgi:hypothetical protein